MKIPWNSSDIFEAIGEVDQHINFFPISVLPIEYYQNKVVNCCLWSWQYWCYIVKGSVKNYKGVRFNFNKLLRKWPLINATPIICKRNSCLAWIPAIPCRGPLFNYRALVFQVMCTRFMSTKIISLVRSKSQLAPSASSDISSASYRKSINWRWDEVKTRRI